MARTRDTIASGRHWPLVLLLGVFFCLCAAYNVALPPFEASDEAAHFIYADYLAREGHLPDLRADLPAHEATQPPLYYIGVASVIHWFDRSGLAGINKLNPDWFDKSVNPDFMSVKNQYIHTPAEEWPWSGIVWALHIARLLSSVLGACTVALIYRAACSLRGVDGPELDPVALFAASLAALNPKFIHISSIVSNDVAVTLAATAACAWLIDLTLKPEPIARTARWAILGVLVGLAGLCKISALGLLAPATAGLLLASLPLQARPRAPRAWLAFALGLLLTLGPWSALNLATYGNPLAWDQIKQANASLLRPAPLNFPAVFASAPRVLESFWGVLGIELHFPGWVDWIFHGALALAMIGCAARVARTPRRFAQPDSLILIAWTSALLLLFVLWLRQYVGTENGRLLMPALLPVTLGVTLGWRELLGAYFRAARRLRHEPAPPFRKTLALIPVSGMAALAIAAPIVVIQPAFSIPTPLNPQQSAAIVSRDAARFGEKLVLAQASVAQRRVRPGQSVQARLYWSAIEPIQQSYRTVLELVRPDGAVVGRRMAIPLEGRYSTERWPAGALYEDTYSIPVDSNAPSGAAEVRLSVFAQYPQPGLLALAGGERRYVVIGRVKIIDAPAAQPPASAIPIKYSAAFSNTLSLTVIGYPQPEMIELTWTCLSTPSRDYTVFIHVLDSAGKLIAQDDSLPQQGGYYTSLCDAGDVIVDRHALSLLPEASRVEVGWYDASSGERLPAARADGSPWPDGAAVVWERGSP